MTTTHNAITDVPGVRVGHAENAQAATGCTVVLCEKGAVGGVAQVGGAPGTRETDLLRPMHMVEKAHAVLLSGGSAFGLAAADGVVRWLEEHKIGFNVGVARVPIVPAAILFDLDVGDSAVRPGPEMGHAACEAAKGGHVPQGSAGAGTGARVGSLFGPDYQMKGGIGTASMALGGGLVIGAIVAVNCFGDVIDPESGRILAGARKPPAGTELADTLATLPTFVGKAIMRFASARSTVIGVVATNASMTKEQANKLAHMAQDGVARTIRPAHTMFDGDTLFALGTGGKKVDFTVVSAFAAEVVAQAILNGVRAATSLGGRPAAQDMASEP
jgi:L-aminopeptidase/D-esterase-like protein